MTAKTPALVFHHPASAQVVVVAVSGAKLLGVPVLDQRRLK
jgi:hypothetical protein